MILTLLFALLALCCMCITCSAFELILRLVRLIDIDSNDDYYLLRAGACRVVRHRPSVAIRGTDQRPRQMYR